MSTQIADVIIVKNDKVLLVQQRKESAYGLWSFPGGHIEKDETLEEAVIREVREELGVDLLKPEYQKTYPLSMPDENLEINTFSGELSGEIKLNEDELLAFGWFTIDELTRRKDALRSPSVIDRAKDAIERERTRQPIAILFDVDGVLTLSEEVFSVIYTKSHGLDIAPFTQFFENEWADYVTGKRDLKQHITENPGLWKWDGSPEGLLQYWFQSEDVRNEELIELIQQIRQVGIRCYVVTEQEVYRTDYMRNVMFRDLFDGIFSTCELGYKKNNPMFFSGVINQIQSEIGGLEPSDILYFDDSESKVQTASGLGIAAHLYKGVDQVRAISLGE